MTKERKGDAILKRCMSKVGIETWTELFEEAGIKEATSRRRREEPSNWRRYEEVAIKRVLNMSDADFVAWVEAEN